ncbi:MAG: hypothetical protein PHN89_04730 [Candidatus Pacebacteria bacterium]|nr:hypothetical protein [Candidatus Paceibacterota bacterium]
MPAQCSTCTLPADIKEKIYFFLVQKGLNRRETHKEIIKLCEDRKLTSPLQSSFYQHCRNHLDVEQEALARIAKNEAEVSENARGFRSLVNIYLKKKNDEEIENRRALKKLVLIINSKIENGNLDNRDLAALGRTLTHTINVLRDTNLTGLVFDELISDLLARSSFGILQLVAETLGKTRRTLKFKIPNHADEVNEELMKGLDKIISGADEVRKSISLELSQIRRYEGPGEK